MTFYDPHTPLTTREKILAFVVAVLVAVAVGVSVWGNIRL